MGRPAYLPNFRGFAKSIAEDTGYTQGDNESEDAILGRLQHRKDRRVIRLIVKWLNAGVMDAGEWRDDLRGTPQGSVISPILANVYLHYVLDLWFQKKWRSHERTAPHGLTSRL